MHRIVFTVRRTAHIVAASIAVELALDFGAGAAAVIVAPFIGTWVYAVAGVAGFFPARQFRYKPVDHVLHVVLGLGLAAVGWMGLR